MTKEDKLKELYKKLNDPWSYSCIDMEIKEAFEEGIKFALNESKDRQTRLKELMYKSGLKLKSPEEIEYEQLLINIKACQELYLKSINEN